MEALGFELPKPDKPLGRYNNRKITFDAACRTMLFEIAKRHGLELDEVPEYGGRAYLEKRDYIMAKQKEQLAQQEKAVQKQTAQLENLKQENEKAQHQQVRRTTYQSLTLLSNDKKIQKQEKQLSELSQKIEDTENLLDEISAVAYDKAVAVVSENAVNDALKASTEQVDIFGLAERSGANGKQGNIGLHHISNHNAAEKYYCSSKQDYRKIDNCPYKAGNQKACHRANQRKYSSVCSTKAASEAGRNQSA